MGDELVIAMVPIVNLTDELKAKWDEICETTDCYECEEDERDEWIQEMKDLKDKYIEYCDADYHRQISHQSINGITYMIAGGSSYDDSNYAHDDFCKIEQCGDLGVWLHEVANERVGLTHLLTVSMAEQFIKDPDSVELSVFSDISDDMLKVLAKSKNDLDLGLTKLSDLAADSLSKCKGDLFLDGLSELSDASAESLSKQKGVLSLGLTKLSDASAESLSKHEGELYLESLTELSDSAAEHIANYMGELDLSGLTELSDEAAESLSKCKGFLNLSGLKELSDAAAKSLARIDPEKLGIPDEIDELVARYR